MINEAVCEGCGDCSVKSNCVSVVPLETEFGRKRTIDQSACNKDFSCVKGFCPSFVTVEGGKLKKSKAGAGNGDDGWDQLPHPLLPSIDAPYNILINGIGGTGVITVGALMGMAAHLEGKGASVLDMTGMSQKNGSVTSHVKIAATPDRLRAQRIATGEADLVLGCDMMTAGATDAISKMRPGRTTAIVNLHEQPPGTFAQQADWEYPAEQVRSLINEAVGAADHDSADFLDATRLATALMGDSIAANLFMMGYAWQKGLIPLTEASLLRAIELNGVAVASNKKSFLWGRRAAVDFKRVEKVATPSQAILVQMPQSLDSVIKKRVEFLTGYQDSAWALVYEQLVARVRAAETEKGLGNKLSMAVAKYYFKLMAYKDEYEVARLYTDGRFVEQLKSQFEGEFTLKFNMAPPLFAKKDAKGRLMKAEFGSWMWTGLKVLAKLKGLRGGALDVFGYTAERRMERALIGEYRAMVESLLAGLDAGNHATAVELANLPEQIRGFGHVKERNVDAFRQKKDALLAALTEQQKVA
jgi:indolepyruvate ferredoxin oxidoreductase